MSVQLYLSMTPESLVASMLPPERFGAYMATGAQKQSHGPVMFFGLKRPFSSGYFRLGDIEQRCVPHPDGEPKHSVYVSIYRVLEHIPLEAIGTLWLTTAHGRTLGLEQASPESTPSARYHLYQELCPVHPVIASSLGPADFCQFITDPSAPVSVPRICFAEMELSGLADDPEQGFAGELPYPNIDHLRTCLFQLTHRKNKQTKTVDRAPQQGLLYRCVHSGFYVGDRKRMLHFPYPTRQEMESDHYDWWRCANDTEVDKTLVSP